MKRMWTPWRMQYIMNIDKKGCVFCEKLKEGDDKAFILKRKPKCFSMLNIYPYNNGHLMVAPKRHVADLDKLTKQEMDEIMQMLAESQKLIREKMKPQGFNIGLNIGKCSGAGVLGHLHFHVVPRWEGDTNFMPVLDDTKIMPQMLEETYRLLKK